MSFSIYLHYPFCRNRCSYCDFYKELYDGDTERAFFEALYIETELAAEQHASNDREITTIFVGGGTPSLANLSLFGKWLNQIHSLFQVKPGIEFSMEANPESVTREFLEEIKSFGVTRPTFGIQSFDQRALTILERRHNPDDSSRAAYLAHALGFESFGVDLLFGLPFQGSKQLAKDLDEILELDPPHISYYSLTVEDGTDLQRKVKRGDVVLPDNDMSTAFYQAGVDSFGESGYEQYEVCSFAKPGHECKHNLGYWLGDDYLGLGPSAHSFINGRRFANSNYMKQYLSSLKDGKRPLISDEPALEKRLIETIMLGLRTRDGINRDRFALKFGTTIEEKIDRKQFDLFVKSGHLISDKQSLRVSPDALILADEITVRLVK